MMISAIVFVGGFVLLGFFAGIEMSFVSCNKIRIRHMADKGSASARLIDEMQGKPQLFLASVLLYQNICHVMLTSAFAYIFEAQLRVTDPFVDTAILAPFLVIFAEMAPKEYCRQKADELILRFAYVLRVLLRLTQPIMEQIIGLSEKVIRRIEGSEAKKAAFVTRSELRALIHESAEKGIVLDHEKRLIDKIFEFEHRPISEIMLPLSGVSRLSIDSSIKQLKELAQKRSSHAFWAVVYENEASNIVGFIHLFDVVFHESDEAGIRQFVRTPLFMRSSASNAEAFLLLQSKRETKAAVVDKSNRPIGVITIKGLIQF